MGKGGKIRVVSRANIFLEYLAFALARREVILHYEFSQVQEAGFFTNRDSFFEVNFETVVFGWVVRSGDGNSEVDIEATSCKMDHGCGYDTEINHIRSLIGNTAREFGIESRRRSSDISADGNFFGAKVHDYRPTESIGEIIIKFFAVNPADIIGLENLRFKHR